MASRVKRRPRATDIIFIRIPGVKDPHPAVVVLGVGARFILMTGSSSPQDETPTVELSMPVAISVGLDRRTGFYRKWIYLWTPTEPSAEIVGEFPALPFTDVRRATMAELGGMGAAIGGLIKKLPEDCLLELATVLELVRIAKSAQATTPAPEEPPSP